MRAARREQREESSGAVYPSSFSLHRFLAEAWRRLSPWYHQTDHEDAEISLMEAEQARAVRRIEARLRLLGVEADVLGRGGGDANGQPD
jgi:hypothetical protein